MEKLIDVSIKVQFPLDQLSIYDCIGDIKYVYWYVIDSIDYLELSYQTFLMLDIEEDDPDLDNLIFDTHISYKNSDTMFTIHYHPEIVDGPDDFEDKGLIIDGNLFQSSREGFHYLRKLIVDTYRMMKM